jgi:hypothetical protein
MSVHRSLAAPALAALLAAGALAADKPQDRAKPESKPAPKTKPNPAPATQSERAVKPRPAASPKSEPPEPGSQAQPDTAEGEKIIWTGRSGGYSWRWTTQDITARSKPNTEPPRFSAIAPLKKEIGEGVVRGDYEDRQEYRERLTVLSVVGSIVSYERASYDDLGGAHPHLYTRYIAADVSREKGPVKLTDLFPDKDVLKAFLADPLVRKALERLKAEKDPKTTEELVRQLSREESTPDDSVYQFGPDLLNRFAFHHLEGDRVAVRIGLSHKSELSRGTLTQVGLLLPVSSRMKGRLARAASGDEGFLMDEAKKRFGDQCTLLEAVYLPRKQGRKAR